MTRIIHFSTVVLLTGILFSGCTEEMQNKLKTVPVAFGSLNHITVIADQQLWEGPVGDTFRYYFGSPYLILPQPEPVFDLKHFTVQEIEEEPVRKNLHTYIVLANMKDSDSPAAKMIRRDIGEEKAESSKDLSKPHSSTGRNKWAKDQLLIYLYAYSDDALIQSIRSGFPAARQKIYEVHNNRLVATVFHGEENRKVMDQIQSRFGVEMRIPKDYTLALDDGSTLWLRKEMDDLSSNLLLTKVKYRDTSQLSKEGIKALRDSLGKKYISTRIENTYMRTNDVDLPMFLERISLNNRYCVEVHGIWDMVNDYMGGPFVSYAVVNETSGEIFFADGFVFAPGKDKRDHMQYLEAICKTIKF